MNIYNPETRPWVPPNEIKEELEEKLRNILPKARLGEVLASARDTMIMAEKQKWWKLNLQWYRDIVQETIYNEDHIFYTNYSEIKRAFDVRVGKFETEDNGYISDSIDALDKPLAWNEALVNAYAEGWDIKVILKKIAEHEDVKELFKKYNLNPK